MFDHGGMCGSIFMGMEESLRQALSEAWPALREQTGLSLFANLAPGVMRVVSDEWRKDPKAQSLSDDARDGFRFLERQ
jgi:hypothetical protein